MCALPDYKYNCGYLRDCGVNPDTYISDKHYLKTSQDGHLERSLRHYGILLSIPLDIQSHYVLKSWVALGGKADQLASEISINACGWNGVICADTGHVTGISWFNRNLIVTAPTSVGKLLSNINSFLKYLYFDFDQVTCREIL